MPLPDPRLTRAYAPAEVERVAVAELLAHDILVEPRTSGFVPIGQLHRIERERRHWRLQLGPDELRWPAKATALRVIR